MTTRFLYVEADTFIHRMHPNTKLLCLVLLFAAVMAFNHPIHEGLLLLAGLGLLRLSRSLTNITEAGSFSRLIISLVALGLGAYALVAGWEADAASTRVVAILMGIVLFAAAGWLVKLTTGGRFMVVIFAFSALLWTFFVKDIEGAHILREIKPVLVERGTTAYDLVIVMIIAGLLALAITLLSLVQIVVRDIQRTAGTAPWYIGLAGIVLVGVWLVWRGPALVPQLWLWYVILIVYLLAGTVLVFRRLRTPYALALWLALILVTIGAYYAMSAFLVHLHMPGTRFMWGPTFELSQEALLYGPAMGLRIIAFLTFGLVFISTTSPEELTQGLRGMGMALTPSIALSLAFRLVPTFVGTARTVMEAQRSRGLDLESGGPATRLKRAVPVIVPTLAYALRSADDLTRALETRGLGAGATRTDYRELATGRTDRVAVILVAVITAACIAARIGLNFGELLPRL